MTHFTIAPIHTASDWTRTPETREQVRAIRSAIGAFTARDIGKRVVRQTGGHWQAENDAQRDARRAGPPPIYGLKVAYRPYACCECGTVQSIQTNHTGPLVAVCTGCNDRGIALPVETGAPWAGKFPRRVVYAGPPITWADLNRHALPPALVDGMGTYSLDSTGGQAIASGWILFVTGQPAPPNLWPFLAIRGWHAAKAQADKALTD